MKLSTQTHFSQGWNTNLLEDIESLGTNMIRDSVPWNRAETSKGMYDFSHRSATWVEKALSAGMEVVLVFNPVNKLYDSGHSIHSDTGREAFAAFVVATLQAFPGVTSIEIGNEYNGNSFVTGPIARASKTERDDFYNALAAEVDAAIDGAGLDIEIIGASTHSIPVDYFSELTEGGVLEHVDAVSIHPYTTEPEQFAAQLDVLRSAIGEDTRIHVTEFGDNFETLEDAPAFLAKMVSVMAAAGVESANWYAFAQQKWFVNMELWNQRSGEASPAGVTFSLMEEMLAGGQEVNRLEIDSYTYLYTFGDNAAILWGEARGITLGSGLEAFDLAGNKVTDLSQISPDTPVILRSTAPIDVNSFTLEESALIADSFHDFDLTNLTGNLADFEGPWSYFAEAGTGRALELSTQGGGLRSGEPWRPYLGHDSLRPLQIGASSLTPADFSPNRSKPKNEFATVERFTADQDMTVAINGHWDVSDRTADGVLLTIEINDEIVLREVIFDKSNGHVFDLELSGIELRAGDTIDFVISARNNARGDVTERHIQIFDEELLNGESENDEAGGDETGNDEGGNGENDDSQAPDEPEAEIDNPFDQSEADGNVRIKGSSGDDLIIGGEGKDKLDGRDGADSLFGGGGNDIIQAGAEDLIIDGGEGNDTLIVTSQEGLSLDLALASIEKARGNIGNDIFDGSNLTVSANLRGNAGDDQLYGGSANDSLRGDEGDDYLSGGAGKDKLLGGTGDDRLHGGADNDRLDGGAGNDILQGGLGNDRLAGKEGDDIFLFEDDFGRDTISDFGGGDQIDLSSITSIDDFEDLLIVDTKKGAQITIGDSTILLLKVDADTIDVDDFII